ncbi:redoxin domain-containing protein [Mesobacillus maritimus]|uniref:Redoxin domain-containing protein n=1 Tax=Mesobacillus maritimus TaxID=1643336 RepID=A0ABS7K838_9BACI|nr:redoxin domain-containing protein [Mesobacillus maritimus]
MNEDLLKKSSQPIEFYATRDDKAPSFSADAVDGSEIRRIRLDEFKGKWVVLFFYPSDFTAV